MEKWCLSGLTLASLLTAGWLYVRGSRRAFPWYLVLALTHLVGAAGLALGATVGIALSNHPGLLWCALGLAGTALAGLWRERHYPRNTDWTHPLPAANPPFSKTEFLLSILLVIGLITAVARLLILPLDWDGWAIWQFKAKALAAGNLQGFLTSREFGFAHPDYPLLVPSLTWWLSPAGFSTKVSQYSSFVFFLDLLAIFYGLTTKLVTRRIALVGCVTLVSWPLVMKHSMSGFADLTLATFILTTAYFLAEDDWWLAAPCLVGAVLTKNEGLFTFAGTILVGVTVAIIRWRARNTRPLHPGDRRASFITAGAGSLGVLVWWIVKQRWELSGDLLDTSRWPANPVIAILERIPIVAYGFIRECVAIGPKYPGWGLFWPVSILGLVVSIRRRETTTTVWWIIALVHLAGTAMAYLLTPLDPALHISRSLDRLLLQIAPTVLLAALVALGRAELDTRLKWRSAEVAAHTRSTR